jgi:ABC-type nitrate/sulfonate/bicarbonate transport system substrate-binding protein
VVNFRNSADMIPAGISGAVNLINSGVEQPELLTQRGGVPPWRGIVATYGASAFSIVAQPRLTNLVPNDFKQFKGMKVGIPGFGRPAHSLIKAFLKEAGLDPDNDVSYVEQPPGPEGIASWERGLADIAVTNEPVTSALMVKKTARMFIDLREGKHGPASTVPQAIVLAPVSLINSNRGELERFALSICQTAKRALSNIDVAANAAAERFGANTGADAAIVKTGLVASAVAWKPDVPEVPTMAWIKLLQDSGIIKIQPRFNEIIDTSFSKNWRC